VTIEISFADLSHTGKTVDANFFPLGCGYIASYALEHLKGQIEVQVFKYPADFSAYLEQTIPRIACFSNYSWNLGLNYEYARHLKARHPHVITVFGGPNYPIEEEVRKQEAFLREHPAIDLYVDGEGEIAFTELYKILEEFNFDIGKFKDAHTLAPSTHYVNGEHFVRGEMLPRIRDVNVLPSPFLNGVLDKFFDDKLTPAMQSHRGCPYSCAFCRDGIKYMSKLGRFTQARINAEITYINDRSILPSLCFVDLNFGIYKEDLETAHLLADLQRKYNWPKFVMTAPAKNNTDRVVEISKIIPEGFFTYASVQSTDPEVLENIQRSNVSIDKLTYMARETTAGKTGSFSEVILCLPGDTKEKHFKSVFEMLDLGIEEMRVYQFILLSGTVGASREYVEKYKYDTRFRVLPRCFGNYQVLGDEFRVFEYHEVCVGNDTMPYEDYIQCRCFDLMVEIFNNGGIHDELLVLLEREDILRSAFFKKLYDTIDTHETFVHLFREFIKDEERNFWTSREDIEDFIRQPETMEAYMSGEYGANQIMQYRSQALLEHMDEINDLSFATARKLLDENGKMNEKIAHYLEELSQYILMKKGNLFSLDSVSRRTFHYDFVKLNELRFDEDPFLCSTPDGLEISFGHSKKLMTDIETYYRQYGRTVAGLGHFMQRGNLSALYRQVGYT